MPTNLDAVALAFAVVFAAEFGDKTQLMVLALASRLRAGPVLVGVAVAAAGVSAVSVGIGAGIGAVIPTALVTALAGLIFLAFALWTARETDEEEDEAPSTAAGGRSAVGVGVAFFLAELGDKTMLATVALAARADPVATWAGATLALVAVSAIAIAVGRQLGSRLPRALVRRLAAGAFALFGVLLLVEAFRSAVAA